MTPQLWFEQLAAELPGGQVVEIGDGERAALLDLARVAAHSSERWTAPVTTFLVGVALASATPAERVATMQRLVNTLDT